VAALALVAALYRQPSSISRPGAGNERRMVASQQPPVQEDLQARQLAEDQVAALKAAAAATTPRPEPSMTGKPKAGLSTAAAQATRRAWKRIGEIDLELRSLAKNNPLAFWEHNYILYGRIDTDDVDPELAALIRDWIKAATDMHDALCSYVNERAQIVQRAEDAAHLGALLGSTSEHNPQQGAAAGALMFGMLGSAVADMKLKELNRKYEPRFRQIDNRVAELIQRHDTVGELLSQRYHTPFRRKL
jgi:hypothetical protein